jgi:hypothetical protein
MYAYAEKGRERRKVGEKTVLIWRKRQIGDIIRGKTVGGKAARRDACHLRGVKSRNEQNVHELDVSSHPRGVWPLSKADRTR